MLIFPEPEKAESEDCFVPFASGLRLDPEVLADLEKLATVEQASSESGEGEDRALRARIPESVRDLRESPGEVLSARLKEKRMTQVALARRMGVSETTISRMIKDHQPISAERACVLEGILGVPALDFVVTQASFGLRMARLRARQVRAVVEYDSEPTAPPS